MAKRNIPKEDAGKYQTSILILFALSLLFFVLARHIPLKDADAVKMRMIRASEIMVDAMSAIRDCRKERGLVLDKNCDINSTGLIGLEFSPLTTSLGNLEAKRTTTNPNFAGLVVFLLNEAGVKEGEVIAVGASGSFPALIVTMLAAAKAMNLRPLVICSLGASQWGANNPDFHWLHMQDCLLRTGIFDNTPIVISLGGDRDTGEDMNSENRSFYIKEIRERGIDFIYEPDLKRNVEQKMQRYEENAGESRIKAFINIGGNWSNIGDDSEVLKLKPGLVKIRRIPPLERRGILFEMALRKIPVVHLLNIRGLVRRYRLPWDPVPLPLPGEGKIYQLARERQRSFLFLAVGYFIFVIVILMFRNKLG